MTFKTIKRRPTDILFSQYLRKKIGKCQVCGKIKKLEASHFFGRRHENTRFDERNVDVLCNYDHRRFGEDPWEYCRWKEKRLGAKAIEVLAVDAFLAKERDDKMDMIKIKALVKSL